MFITEGGTLLSLCMIAKNEGDGIGQALRSALPLVDEYIIGIDSATTDNTCDEISRFIVENPKTVVKVYGFTWEGDFSAARNECQERANGNFIFILDGHEYIESGIEKLKRIKIDNSGFDVFVCEIKSYVDNKVTVFEQPRLFKRDYKFHNKSHNVILYDEKKAAKLTGVTIAHKRNKELMNERSEQRKTMNVLDLKNRIANGDRRAMAQIVNEYMSQKNWDAAIGAIKDYLKQIMENRERYQVLIKLSMCYFYKEKLKEAERCLFDCANINDDKRNAHLVFLGDLYRKLGDNKMAIDFFEHALKINKPQTFWFLYPQFYYEYPVKMLEKINGYDNNIVKSDRKTEN